MKKRLLLGIIALVCMGFHSCSSGGDVFVLKAEEPKEVESVSATTTLVQLDTISSTVMWVGRKPGGSHMGTIKLQSGYLEYSEQGLVGGRVVFSMTSISNTDISDLESRTKLETHLKSADFFNVDQFPTADFVITKVVFPDSNKPLFCNVDGNLTIKGNVKSISFPATVEVNNNQITVSAGPLAINRTDWGVNYGSKSIFDNLKDKFIEDNIELTISLTATK